MPQGKRTRRVSEEFREILAEEIMKLKDPRVGFVTVTGVTVTPDLRHARVFFTTFGDERARRATVAALRSARGHLRQVVGHQVRLKVVPELEFEEDQTIEHADRIDTLLRELHRDEEGSSSEAVARDEEGSSSEAVARREEGEGRT